MLVFFGKFCERHKWMIPNFYQYFLRLLRFPDLDFLIVCLTYVVGTENPWKIKLGEFKIDQKHFRQSNFRLLDDSQMSIIKNFYADLTINYYHKALHLGCCSSPRSASDLINLFQRFSRNLSSISNYHPSIKLPNRMKLLYFSMG